MGGKSEKRTAAFVLVILLDGLIGWIDTHFNFDTRQLLTRA
jgi:hypothetical protein